MPQHLLVQPFFEFVLGMLISWSALTVGEDKHPIVGLVLLIVGCSIVFHSISLAIDFAFGR